MQTIEAPPAEAQPESDLQAKRRPSRTRRIAMRLRRAMVKVHRWLALVLFAWFIVISITGAWLVVHHAVESWIHPDRYTATEGDVGAQAALDAGATALPEGRVRLRAHRAAQRARRVPRLWRDPPARRVPRDRLPELRDRVRGSRHRRRERGAEGRRRRHALAVPRARVPVAGPRAVRCLRPGDGLVSPERRRPRAGGCQGRGVRRAARRHGHDRLVLARLHRGPAHGLLPLVLARRAALGNGPRGEARARALRLPPVAAPGGGSRVLGAPARRRVHRRRLRLPEHEQVVRERHARPARLRSVGTGRGAGAGS